MFSRKKTFVKSFLAFFTIFNLVFSLVSPAIVFAEGGPHTLTYLTDGLGYIIGEDVQSVEDGGDGTEVTAVSDDPFCWFSYWSDELYDNTRIDTNITESATYTAYFECSYPFFLNYIAGDGGSIDGDIKQWVQEGNDGSPVTAVPNDGYTFTGWSDGWSEEGSNNPRIDAAVGNDIEVTANFEEEDIIPEIYTLNYSANAGGSILGKSSQTVKEGEDGNLVTAVPNLGYHFISWTDAKINNPRKDLNVTENITVAANFEENLSKKIMTSASWTKEGGCTGAYLGGVILNGNFNNDSYDDIALPFYCSGSSTFYMHVYYGSVSGFAETPDEIFTLVSAGGINTKEVYPVFSAYKNSFDSIDINNDGYDDIVVSDITYSTVHVFFSSPTGFETASSLIINSNWENAGLAFLKKINDINNDGYDDIALCTNEESLNNLGKIKIYYSSSTNNGFPELEINTTTTADWSLELTREDCDVSSGDINNDGFNDIIIGDTYFNNGDGGTSWDGRILVFYGSSSGLSSGPDQILSTDGSRFLFGNSIMISDFNNDGYGDIASSDYYGNIYIFLYNSSTSQFPSSADYSIKESVLNNSFIKISSEDINNDGYNDIIKGYRKREWDPETESTDYYFHFTIFYFDSSTGFSNTPDWDNSYLVSSNDYGLFRPIGDIDNDGYIEVLGSLPYYDNEFTNQGKVFLFTNTTDTFTLSYSAGVGGSITGETSQTVYETYDGSTVTATPEYGYVFTSWSDGVTSSSRTDIYVTSSISVTASFTQLTTHTLNYVAGVGGSITGETSQTVYETYDGSTVTATPEYGYVFTSWSDGITSPSRTDTYVTSSISVTANFTQLTTHTLNYVAGEGGSISGDASQIVYDGYSGTAVTAVPDIYYYYFVNWSDGRTDNPRQDLNVMGDITVTANFAILPAHTLVFEAGTNGSFFELSSSTQIIYEGSNSSPVEVIPNAGYNFVSWQGAPLDIMFNNPITIINPTSSATYTAMYSPITYTLNYTVCDGVGGSLSGNTMQMVLQGGDGSPVTALPNEGYTFNGWWRNEAGGYYDSYANPRTDTNVTYSISVCADFDSTPTYNLTFELSDLSSGTLVGTTTQSVVSGGNATPVEFVVNEGYEFEEWNWYDYSIGSTVTSRENPLAIEKVYFNYDIMVLANPIIYNITYRAGAGGQIGTEKGSDIVVQGDIYKVGGTQIGSDSGVLVWALPDPGYEFLSWSDASTTNPRTETNVQSNLDITANFGLLDLGEPVGTATVSLTKTKERQFSNYYFNLTTTANIPGNSEINILFPNGFGLDYISVANQFLVTPGENILIPEKYYNIENTSPAEVNDVSAAFLGAYGGNLTAWQSLVTSTWQYIQFPGETSFATPTDYLVTSTYGLNSDYSLWSHRGCIEIDPEDPDGEECLASHDYIYVSKIDNLEPNTTYTMYFWADMDFAGNEYAGVLIIGLDENFNLFDSSVNSWVPFSMPENSPPPFVKMINSDSGYLAESGDWKQYAFTFKTDDQTAFYPVLAFMNGPKIGEFHDWYFDDFYLAEGEFPYINSFSTSGQMLILDTGEAGISSGTNISFTINDILNPIDSEIYSDFLLFAINGGSLADGPWDTNDITINPVINEGNIEINAGSTLFGARTYYNFSVTTTENIPAGKTVKIIFPEGYGLTPTGISVDYQNIIIPGENILTPGKFYNIENTSPAEVTDASMAFLGAFGGNLSAWQSLTTGTWQYIQFPGRTSLANPSDYLVTSTYGNSSSSYSLWSHRGCISEEFPGSDNCTESHDYIYVSKIDNLTPNTTYTMYFWADMDFDGKRYTGVLILGSDENFNLFDSSVNSWVPFSMPKNGPPPFVKMINSDSDYLAESGDWKQYAFTFKTDDQIAFYPVLAFMNGPDEVGVFYDWYFDDFYLTEGQYSYVTDVALLDGMENSISLQVGDQEIPANTKVNFTIQGITNPVLAGAYSAFTMFFLGDYDFVDGYWTSDFEISNYPTVGEIEINASSTLSGENTDYTFSVTTTEYIPADSRIKISFPNDYILDFASVTRQFLVTPGANLLTSSTFYSIEGLEDVSSGVEFLPADGVNMMDMPTDSWYWIAMGDSISSAYLVSSTYGHNSSYSLHQYRIKDEFADEDGRGLIFHKNNLKPSTTYTMYFWVDGELDVVGNGIDVVIFNENLDSFVPATNSWVSGEPNPCLSINSVMDSYIDIDGEWKKYAVTFVTAEGQNSVFPYIKIDGKNVDWFYDDFYLVEGEYPYITEPFGYNLEENTIMLPVGNTAIEPGTKINFTINDVTNPLTAGLYSEFAMYMYDSFGFLDGYWRSDFEITEPATYTLTYNSGDGGVILPALLKVQTVNEGGKGQEVNAIPNIGYYFVDWSDSSTQNPRQDLNVMEDITVTANFASITSTIPLSFANLFVGSEMVNENTSYTFGVTTTQNIYSTRELNILFPDGFDLTSATLLDQTIFQANENSLDTQFSTIEGIMATEIASGTMAISNIFKRDLTQWQNLATSTWFFASMNEEALDPQVGGFLTSSGSKGHNSDYSLWNHREEFEGDLWYDYFHFAKIDNLEEDTTYTFSFWVDADYVLGDEELGIFFADENLNLFDSSVNSWVPFSMPENGPPPFVKMINSDSGYLAESGDWKQYAFTFSTEDQTAFYPVLILNAYGTGLNIDWYFDDFSLAKGADIAITGDNLEINDQIATIGLYNAFIASDSEIILTIDGITNPSVASEYSDFSLYFLATDNTLADGPWGANLEILDGEIPGETYTLTYTAGTGGTISGISPQTVEEGGDGTEVVALANTGYSFVDWSDGVSTSSRIDTNVRGDITVTANFAINTYTIDYGSGDGGFVTGTTSQIVNYNGSGSSVTAVPNTGYHFTHWSDDNTNPTRTETNVTEDLNFRAYFAINTYTLSYSAGENGIITAFSSSTQIVNYGENGTEVSVVPDEGYHFVSWSDGVTTASRTDLNVTEDITVTANFAETLDEYLVTYSAGSNGSISGSSTQWVDHGSDASTVTAVPNTGYSFVDWSDGVTTASRTDLNVLENKTITANFAINTYTLTYSAGSNGSISGSSSQNVNYGGSGSAVTAVANSGYRFSSWSDGGTSNPRTDTNVTSNITVTANFSIISSGGGGSVGPTAPTVFDINFSEFIITEKDCEVIININNDKVERIAISDTINFANSPWNFYSKNFSHRLKEYADEIFIKVRSKEDLSSETFNYKIKNECVYKVETIIEEVDESDEDKKDATGPSVSYGIDICSEKYINTNLTIGSRGSEVKALQVFLNSVGFKIADSGIGAPGNETEYFGALTLEALNRYRELCKSVSVPIIVENIRDLDDRGCPMLRAGDLYKVPNSNSVYYLNAQKKSMYFPTEEVFFSWGFRFSDVITISDFCFDDFEQATPGGLNFRPGSRLVKRVESPTVYAVLPGNTRAAIASESVAKALYGADWAGLVRDLPGVFMSNFLNTAEKIETPVPHNGQFIRETGTNIVYYVLNNKLYEIIGNVTADVREVSSQVLNSVAKADDTITLYAIMKYE